MEYIWCVCREIIYRKEWAYNTNVHVQSLNILTIYLGRWNKNDVDIQCDSNFWNSKYIESHMEVIYTEAATEDVY